MDAGFSPRILPSPGIFSLTLFRFQYQVKMWYNIYRKRKIEINKKEKNDYCKRKGTTTSPCLYMAVRGRTS